MAYQIMTLTMLVLYIAWIEVVCTAITMHGLGTWVSGECLPSMPKPTSLRLVPQKRFQPEGKLENAFPSSLSNCRNAVTFVVLIHSCVSCSIFRGRQPSSSRSEQESRVTCTESHRVGQPHFIHNLIWVGPFSCCVHYGLSTKLFLV